MQLTLGCQSVTWSPARSRNCEFGLNESVSTELFFFVCFFFVIRKSLPPRTEAKLGCNQTRSRLQTEPEPEIALKSPSSCILLHLCSCCHLFKNLAYVVAQGDQTLGCQAPGGLYLRQRGSLKARWLSLGFSWVSEVAPLTATFIAFLLLSQFVCRVGDGRALHVLAGQVPGGQKL